jgi:hypothetical protein
VAVPEVRRNDYARAARPQSAARLRGDEVSNFQGVKIGNEYAAAFRQLLADGLEPMQEMVRKAATDRGEIVRPAQAGCFNEAITQRGDLVTC